MVIDKGDLKIPEKIRSLKNSIACIFSLYIYISSILINSFKIETCRAGASEIGAKPPCSTRKQSHSFSNI